MGKLLNAKLLTGAVAIIGLVLAIFFGSIIGDGSYLPIVILLGSAFLLAFFLMFGRSVGVEARIAAALIFGYASFQRLFAELNVGRVVYVGEVGLAIILFFFFARIAFQKFNPLPPHPLTAPILLLILLGALRFVLVDFKAFGLLAARDLATVYYMLFYFIGYGIGRQPNAGRFVLRTFQAGILLYVPLICLLRLFAPANHWIEWASVALGTRDMASIVPAVGFLLCLLYSAKSRRPLSWLGLSLLPLGTTIMGTERSAYLALGLAVVVVLFVLSRSAAGFVTRLGGILFLLLFAVAMLFIFTKITGSGHLTLAAEKVQHIVDFDAFHARHTAIAGSSSSYSEETNRWRAAWWTVVYKETMDKGPWLGLGFGYDLTNRFIREYYADRGEVRARNPHNIVFTFLGRTGFIGASLFAILILILFRTFLRVAGAVRRSAQQLENLEPWLITFIIMMMALFSHTLEGPMASIPFWTFLGIGVAQQVASRKLTVREPEREVAPLQNRPRFAQLRPALRT